VPDCQTAGETSTAKPAKKANAIAVARISRKLLLVMRISLYGLVLQRTLFAFRTRELIYIKSGLRSIKQLCCSAVFVSTNRMFGRLCDIQARLSKLIA
jgi:hypothetical protein